MRAMNCRIEDHLVRLLQITGYSTYQALKEFGLEDFDFIVKFVKGGDILDRVNPEDLHLYLGQCKSREKFSFVPGEKKLLLKVVSYVTKNHTDADKTLGKMSVYPLFSKSSRKASGSTTNAPKKLRTDDDFVLSLDIPKEVTTIKHALQEYCRKNSLPAAISKDIPNLSINIKTVKTDTISYLSGSIICSICKKGQSVQRKQNETWNLSNMTTRHLKNHVSKGDFNQSMLDSYLVQPTIKEALSGEKNTHKETTNSDDEDTPYPESELPTIDLTSSFNESQEMPANSTPASDGECDNPQDFQRLGEEETTTSPQ